MAIKYYTIEFRNKIIQGYEIKLSECQSHTDICALLAPFKIVNYTYEFIVVGEQSENILKVGHSNNSKSHTPIERVYRQAGHLSCWDDSKHVPLKGPSGSEMIDICQRYHKKNGRQISKNDIIIRINDFTNIPNPSQSDVKFLIKKHERHLIAEYKKVNGKLPIGNINDESFIDRKCDVDRSIYSKFFYEENVCF